MKNILKYGIIILIIVTLIPFASGIKGLSITPKASDNKSGIIKSNEKVTDNKDNSEKKLSAEEIEIILAKVMEHITESAHTETKKAMIAICKSNYIYMKEQGETNFDIDISKYSDDFLDELINLYKDNEYSITYKGSLVPIPMVPQNGGYTSTSDEYPYIEPIASPWDTFSRTYIRDAIYPCGVSIYGIGYLCENGMTYKEALLWYLPDFDIN